jgi:hypothetical protein
MREKICRFPGRPRGRAFARRLLYTLLCDSTLMVAGEDN